MSACEECWQEAAWRALMRGGQTADHYPEVLAQFADRHAEPPPEEVPDVG